MAFLKSLICISGCDNGRRFLMISGVVYLLGVSLESALKEALGISLILLLVLASGLLLASVRRVRDAGFNLWLAAAPSLSFLFICVCIGFLEHWSKYILIGLGALISVAFGLLSNARKRRNRTYTLGYSGPALARSSEVVSPIERFSRIEPNLDVESVTEIEAEDKPGFAEKSAKIANFDISIESHQLDENVHSEALSSEFATSGAQFKKAQISETEASGIQTSGLQSIQSWLAQNLKVVFAAVGVVVILGILVISFIQPDTNEPNQFAEMTPQTEVKQRLNKIKMPDNYWLMFDQHKALTIAWQGDFGEDQVIWTAATAQGDESCAKIRFENGESYRLLTATRKNSGDYYADFSPLDSQKLVKAIALRSRFKLCGYEFSLKGTQAIIMANKAYASLIQS
ncbi:hypothetical protein ACUR5C_13795 [Aliikangiella sp. IMCC44653]